MTEDPDYNAEEPWWEGIIWMNIRAKRLIANPRLSTYRNNMYSRRKSWFHRPLTVQPCGQSSRRCLQRQPSNRHGQTDGVGGGGGHIQVISCRNAILRIRVLPEKIALYMHALVIIILGVWSFDFVFLFISSFPLLFLIVKIPIIKWEEKFVYEGVITARSILPGLFTRPDEGETPQPSSVHRLSSFSNSSHNNVLMLTNIWHYNDIHGKYPLFAGHQGYIYKIYLINEQIVQY